MVPKLYHTDTNLHPSYHFSLGIHAICFVLFFLLLLFLPFKTHSQKTPFNLLHYGLEDGLSQVTINDMVFDDSGFLWIGTQEGINRFDGKLFKQYKYSKNDTLGLSGNFITKLFKDSEGNIWIGTARNGLNIYRASKKKNKAGYTSGI